MELAVRGAAAAVLADPRPHRAPARAPARRARRRVRAQRRAGAESVPGRAGGPRPAVRGRRGAAAPLRRRRRAVARPRVGARARVRGPPPAGGEDRARVRGARAERRARAASRSFTSSRWAIAMRGRCWSPSCRRRLDERVLERIVAETRGNPLALLELPRGLTPAQLAGGFGLPAALPLSAGIEESFTRRLARLPRDARRLLLAGGGRPGRRSGAAVARGAAARDPGVGRAHRRVGRLADARTARWCSAIRSFARRCTARPSRTSGARSTARWRRRPIREIDPDRRAWHRAQAASVPDEEVAAELERSAARAQARGGFAAAAAFLERAAALTPDPSRRARARAGRGADEVPGGRARRRARPARDG